MAELTLLGLLALLAGLVPYFTWCNPREGR